MELSFLLMLLLKTDILSLLNIWQRSGALCYCFVMVALIVLVIADDNTCVVHIVSLPSYLKQSNIRFCGFIVFPSFALSPLFHVQWSLCILPLSLPLLWKCCCAFLIMFVILVLHCLVWLPGGWSKWKTWQFWTKCF